MLAGLVSFGALCWMFIELADEITERETLSVDHVVLRALRTDAAGTDPIGPAWLERALVDISALGSGGVTTLVVIMTLGFLLLAGKPRMALLVVACALGAWSAMHLLKDLFDRGRPDIVLQMDEAPGLAFPSGHAMISAALYITLGVLLSRTLQKRRLQLYIVTLAAALALLIGFTRVYMGVHYPTDVIAGWTIGLAWALLCSLVARALQRRGVVEPVRERI